MASRIYDHSEFAAETLAANRERSVSVCIPALNEEATIGVIVGSVLRNFSAAHGGVDLVDEVIVVDDGSEDHTSQVARAAGARVVSSEGAHGKGEAMRLATESSAGDVLVFLDGDVDPFPAHFVSGLLGPLLVGGAAMVKATYTRPWNGIAGEGGRVNELVARPVISLLYPELEEIRQPLAGETAVTRAVLDKVRLASGYGVEIALLIDVAAMFGAGSIAQVDVGTRAHRNRPLGELRPLATEVMRIALERSGVPVSAAEGNGDREIGQSR